MKNLLLVFADLAMNKSGSYRWIAASIMNKVRIVSMVLVFSILSLIVIGSALNMVMSDLQRTTELQQSLGMTSVSAVGLAIIIGSLTAICLFFRKSFWGLDNSVKEESSRQMKSEPAVELSPIVQALSVLVMDFVDERREKRQREANSVGQILG